MKDLSTSEFQIRKPKRKQDLGLLQILAKRTRVLKGPYRPATRFPERMNLMPGAHIVALATIEWFWEIATPDV